jgi:hypothetical protein
VCVRTAVTTQGTVCKRCTEPYVKDLAVCVRQAALICDTPTVRQAGFIHRNLQASNMLVVSSRPHVELAVADFAFVEEIPYDGELLGLTVSALAVPAVDRLAICVDVECDRDRHRQARRRLCAQRGRPLRLTAGSLRRSWLVPRLQWKETCTCWAAFSSKS